jgi:hypothetical protein
MAPLSDKEMTLRRSRIFPYHLCHILPLKERRQMWVSVESPAIHCFSIAEKEGVDIGLYCISSAHP